MKRSLSFLAVLGLCCVGAVAAGATEPDDAIQYRKAVMSSVGANMTAMGLIAQGKIENERAFIAHAELLASSLALAPDAFRQKTAGQGREQTTSRPNIWDNWEDFEQKFQDVEDKANQILSLASTGGVESAAGELRSLAQGCKGCHDDYRTK